MPETNEIAWLAGLLEGEGCFGKYTYTRRLNKQYTKTVLQLEMNDQDVVRKAQKIFGMGGVWSKPPRRNSKETWVWMVTNKQDVENICEKILPYMGSRRSAKILEIFPSLAGRRLQ